MPLDGEKQSIEQTMAQTFDRIADEEKAANASAAAEVAEPVETEDAPETEAPEGETAEQKAERLRAEDGKFRKPTRAEKREAKAQPAKADAKSGDGNATSPAKAAVAAPSDPTTAAAPTKAAPAVEQKTDQNPTGLAGVNPPAGWSAAAKAAFASLPPAVQAAVSRREQEVASGFAQYEGIGKALAPMQPLLQARGVQPAAYVSQMVALDQALQNPVTKARAFEYLFQTYGFRPDGNSAAQQPGASNPAMQQSADPTIAALQHQIQQVTSHLTQQEAQRAAYAQAEQQETQRKASADVEAFRNDPANEFFDLLRDDIRGVYERAAALNQPAPSLKDAYEAAVWANPQTRPVMLARQAQKESDARAKATADAAAKARKSGGPNLRGSVGASPSSQGPKRSFEEQMAEVYDKLHAS